MTNESSGTFVVDHFLTYSLRMALARNRVKSYSI